MGHFTCISVANLSLTKSFELRRLFTNDDLVQLELFAFEKDRDI